MILNLEVTLTRHCLGKDKCSRVSLIDWPTVVDDCLFICPPDDGKVSTTASVVTSSTATHTVNWSEVKCTASKTNPQVAHFQWQPFSSLHLKCHFSFSVYWSNANRFEVKQLSLPNFPCSLSFSTLDSFLSWRCYSETFGESKSHTEWERVVRLSLQLHNWHSLILSCGRERERKRWEWAVCYALE